MKGDHTYVVDLHGQDAYWEDVPSRLRPKLHYYNTPITVQMSKSDNPASIIRNIFRPGAWNSALTMPCRVVQCRTCNVATRAMMSINEVLTFFADVAGDFVVVKLDIEGHEPEDAFMKALMDDDLGSMVAEMFYELHFGEIFQVKPLAMSLVQS